MVHDYEKLYEDHAEDQAATVGAKASIGDGDFESVGRIELRILELEGLRPDSSLLDFGCGVGRLALQAIPFLSKGRYLGLDIAATMIRGARELVAERLPAAPPERYRFAVNGGERVAQFGGGFDMACAYSVFTHMESEDTYRCLVELASVLREGGKIVCSVLPLEIPFAREIFLREAALAPDARWQRVRNTTTSHAMMEQMAALAGFRDFRWYHGDHMDIRFADGTRHSLGQSALVATKRAPPAGAASAAA